jgi:hypothetical protein
VTEIDKILAAVERSELFAAAREAFYAIPLWGRTAILVAVILAAILTHWILPAWANLIRARREK